LHPSEAMLCLHCQLQLLLCSLGPVKFIVIIPHTAGFTQISQETCASLFCTVFYETFLNPKIQ